MNVIRDAETTLRLFLVSWLACGMHSAGWCGEHRTGREAVGNKGLWVREPKLGDERHLGRVVWHDGGAIVGAVYVRGKLRGGLYRLQACGMHVLTTAPSPSPQVGSGRALPSACRRASEDLLQYLGPRVVSSWLALPPTRGFHIRESPTEASAMMLSRHDARQPCIQSW